MDFKLLLMLFHYIFINDIYKGYNMRSEWVKKRENDPVRTQMYYAKQGIITKRWNM